MQYLQLIMVICSLVAEKEDCEDYYWDCLMSGHKIWDCIVNSPYQNEKPKVKKGSKKEDEVVWPTPITGTF